MVGSNPYRSHYDPSKPKHYPIGPFDFDFFWNFYDFAFFSKSKKSKLFWCKRVVRWVTEIFCYPRFYIISDAKKRPRLIAFIHRRPYILFFDNFIIKSIFYLNRVRQKKNLAIFRFFSTSTSTFLRHFSTFFLAFFVVEA